MHFSIRTLLICTTVVAFYLAAVGLPNPIGVFVMVTCTFVLFPAVGAGAIYGPGIWRAFCIGCVLNGSVAFCFAVSLIVSSIDRYWFGLEFSDYETYYIAATHAFAILGGFVAVAVRSICLRREQT
jgi:hypothetical protein